jgi:hypothetical protein
VKFLLSKSEAFETTLHGGTVMYCDGLMTVGKAIGENIVQMSLNSSLLRQADGYVFRHSLASNS